jgi:hypothetical protein
MTVSFPKLAQPLERALGQRDVAIPIAFATANVQEQALGIDVADLQPQTFAQAQAAGVEGAKGDPMIQRGHRRQDLAHFGGREHDREFELGISADELDCGRPKSLEGFFPEQFDRAERLGGSLTRDLLDALELEEVLAQFLDGDLIGRFLIALAQLADTCQVGRDGARAQGQQEQIGVEVF